MKNSWKKTAAFVLAFTLVAAPLTQTAGKGGVFGGSAITAKAAPPSESDVGTKTGDVTVDKTETLLTTITATGTEQASYSTANVATVSFSYSADGSSAYYDNWGWWGYGWTATVTPVEGYTITKCVFYDDANRTATDSEASFAVETTEEDKTPQVNGTPILANQSKGIKKIEVYGYATPATVSKTETLLTTITPTGKTTYSETTSGVVSVTPTNVSFYNAKFGWLWYDDGGSLSVTAKEGYTITKCVFIQNAKTPITDTEAPFEIHSTRGGITEDTKHAMDGVTSIEVYGYAPSAVELTADNITIADFTYDGTEKTPVLKYGDTVLRDGTDYEFVLPVTDTDTDDTDTASATNAGTYTIHINGKGNYTGENIEKTWKINKAPLNVTAEAKSKTCGESEPVLTYTHGALFGSDTFTGALTREEGENAGTYAIKQGTLSAGDNYNITFKGADFTIKKIPFTLTGAELTYDSKPQNLISGDVPTGTKFTLTEPKAGLDYTTESDKISGWGRTLIDKGQNASSQAVYYYSAASALFDYEYALYYLGYVTTNS